MALPPLRQLETQNPEFQRFRQQTLNQWLLVGGLAGLSMLLMGIVGLAITLFALGYVLITTLMNIYQRLQVENYQHYRQIEALMSLQATLKLHYALPPLRLWSISPDFGLLLAEQVRRRQPTRVLELGSGASTLVLAYALEAVGSGKLISVEHNEEYVERTRRELDKHGLSDWVTVIHAPLTDVTDDESTYRWYDIPDDMDLDQIDILIVDGPPVEGQKMVRYPALPMLFEHLAPDALVIIDDYLRADEHRAVNRWLDEFDLEAVETVANEKGAALLRKTQPEAARELPQPPAETHTEDPIGPADDEAASQADDESQERPSS
ncbi:MAG: O-methyltransferase [Phototrophicaceae bacterium]